MIRLAIVLFLCVVFLGSYSVRSNTVCLSLLRFASIISGTLMTLLLL